jgi:Mg/Co/Ni transporter MgtE
MIFRPRKRFISNPDEVVIQYMAGDKDQAIQKIVDTDTHLLSRILQQFDVQSVCRLFVRLPQEKMIEVFELLPAGRQKEILKQLPPQRAALLVKSVLHETQ